MPMRSAATDPAETTNIDDNAISNNTQPNRRRSISKYQLVNLLSSFRVSLNILPHPVYALCKFQQYQRKARKQYRQDEKAFNDFCFGPTQFFKVMMQGRT